MRCGRRTSGCLSSPFGGSYPALCAVFLSALLIGAGNKSSPHCPLRSFRRCPPPSAPRTPGTPRPPFRSLSCCVRPKHALFYRFFSLFFPTINPTMRVSLSSYMFPRGDFSSVKTTILFCLFLQPPAIYANSNPSFCANRTVRNCFRFWLFCCFYRLF